jgi:hypothetical protein
MGVNISKLLITCNFSLKKKTHMNFHELYN